MAHSGDILHGRNRCLAVVCPQTVASEKAAAPRVRLDVQEGHSPLPKLHPVSDVFRLIASVGRVTGPARPPLVRFVDVKEVQVQAAIAEVRKGGGHFGHQAALRMTAETQSVIPQLELRIEIW